MFAVKRMRSSTCGKNLYGILNLYLWKKCLQKACDNKACSIDSMRAMNSDQGYIIFLFCFYHLIIQLSCDPSHKMIWWHGLSLASKFENSAIFAPILMVIILFCISQIKYILERHMVLCLVVILDLLTGQSVFSSVIAIVFGIQRTFKGCNINFISNFNWNTKFGSILPFFIFMGRRYILSLL